MRLDPSNLQVESFSTATSAVAEPITIWTGKGGPESYCYICYPTGNTDPACQIDPETRFYPCTNNLTCVNCA
jgi:hypothetical protein